MSGNFRYLSAVQRSAIARRGGLAAHAKGTAHEFTSEEAKRAGRLGGLTIGESKTRHYTFTSVLGRFIQIASTQEKMTYRELMRHGMDVEARRYIRRVLKHSEVEE